MGKGKELRFSRDVASSSMMEPSLDKSAALDTSKAKPERAVKFEEDKNVK